MNWQPIETAPKMRKIIVHYLNPLGKSRTVMACYYTEKALEMHDDYEDVGTWDDDAGCSYADAGWYEEHDSDSPVMPLGGTPTHWMPLPEPPEPTETVSAACLTERGNEASEAGIASSRRQWRNEKLPWGHPDAPEMKRCVLCGQPIMKHVVPRAGTPTGSTGLLCPTDTRLQRPAEPQETAR